MSSVVECIFESARGRGGSPEGFLGVTGWRGVGWAGVGGGVFYHRPILEKNLVLMIYQVEKYQKLYIYEKIWSILARYISKF